MDGALGTVNLEAEDEDSESPAREFTVQIINEY
jgi:hypothetical protein